MPVANDLQDVIAEVSAAIAARKTWGRTELEKLRRNLNATARNAGSLSRRADRAEAGLAELAGAVESGVADLAGRARHARTLAPEVAA